MKGRRQVKEGFLSLETWIVYVCHSDGERARQNVSVFERGMVVGARRTSLCLNIRKVFLMFGILSLHYVLSGQCNSQPSCGLSQRSAQKNFFSLNGFSEVGTGVMRGSSMAWASQYAIRSAAAFDT
ncbi:hypothetical protein J4Q44_G00242540 [Coregonus suidteri]|uniref:Uncharacterized protein n=1 Tax=Coregonus suidteri TaxID=861788 RepID=A0AAN8LAR7_9TELE